MSDIQLPNSNFCPHVFHPFCEDCSKQKEDKKAHSRDLGDKRAKYDVMVTCWCHVATSEKSAT